MMIYGRVLTTEEIIAKVEAVTVESTRAAGRALLARGRWRSPRSAPARGLENAATIAHSLASRRVSLRG